MIDYRGSKRPLEVCVQYRATSVDTLLWARSFFPAIFLGSDGKGTASEALRKLSLARTAQIELDMEIKRKTRASRWRMWLP